MLKYFKRFDCFLKYSIILIFLPAIYTGFFSGKITVMTVLCGWILSIAYYNYKNKWNLEDFDNKKIIRLFVLYMLVLYLRGWTNIDSEKDIYAQLGTNVFFCFLFPYLMFLAQPNYLHYVWRSFIWPGLLLCAICFFYPPTDGMMTLAHNATFLNVFILCIPFVKKKWKLLIVAAVLFVVLLDTDRRSIMVNNVVAFLIVLAFPLISRFRLRRIVFGLCIGLPLLFFFLGISGKFNIFEFGDMTTIYLQGKKSERSLLVDSRTSIYKDVFGELKKQKAYVFGLGCNGKTDTSLTDNRISLYTLVYKYGRGGTESGMLNYIQFGGFVAFVLYGLLLVFASYKATFLSNNKFMMSLGLFMAFKFLYSFIEDTVAYNAHTFYMFLWIGMCYNISFRQMDDQQIKDYMKLIFKEKGF